MDEYRKVCGNCSNFDDGICDFNGYVVEPNDFLLFLSAF